MPSSFKKEPKGEEAPASDRFVRGIPSLLDRLAKWVAQPWSDKAFIFCDRLCRTYLEADADLRSKLRKAVVANQAVRDSLLAPYLAEIAKHAKSTGDHTRYLRSALLAISLTDGCGDSRDTLMWLAELWREAEEKGVDPEPHYRQIGEISSTEAVHVIGGSTAAMILQILDEGRRNEFVIPLCGGCLDDRLTSPPRLTKTEAATPPSESPGPARRSLGRCIAGWICIAIGLAAIAGSLGYYSRERAFDVIRDEEADDANRRAQERALGEMQAQLRAQYRAQFRAGKAPSRAYDHVALYQPNFSAMELERARRRRLIFVGGGVLIGLVLSCIGFYLRAVKKGDAHLFPGPQARGTDEPSL